ncbi:MAG: hypothetical protein ACQGVK_15075 [Myxococcota bacterium]
MVLDILGMVGVVAFGLASVIVGVRLLVLGAHTRKVPELTIGIGFVVGVVFGFIPESLVYSTDLVAESWVLPTIRMAEFSIRVCAVAILVFTWRVFRPDARYAVAIVVLLGGAMLASFLIAPNGKHRSVGEVQLAWVTVSFYARTLALVWGTIESLRYWTLCRRRLALGLIDPSVSNRFLVWSVGLGASSFLMGSVLLAPLFGFAATDRSWLLLESALGGVAAGAIWLTFFQPAFYRRWVQADATPKGASEA